MLRDKIIQVLKDQGFRVNPHIRLQEYNKTAFRLIQQKSRSEQLLMHKNFLMKYISKVRNYCRNGCEINPEKISLELIEIRKKSFEETLFKWWNLAWWSIPYQRPYGRQMRFLLWDTAHDSPFGLISLQSPILKISVRDKFLDIPRENLDLWVNMSMQAQRVGSLPPYNELLGGKLVAITLTCNEIREAYKKKYKHSVTLLRNRKLEPDLLFITTTSAFGKSSLYNRLKYNGENVALSLGYTKGSGTFHIPEQLYLEILRYLSKKGYDVSRGFGHGPSRKLKLISLGLRCLKLPKFDFHGIKREFFIFPLVKNLKEVIHESENPIWVDRPFCKLVNYWKERWAIPRMERIQKWKYFNCSEFFDNIERQLKGMEDV
ncbi:Druantia anti-phage system protein DruA [Candidatus Methylacidiphilum infernorum]